MISGGEAAGLCASAVWAVSSLILSRARSGPGAVNLLKCTVASLAFFATLLAGRGLGRGLFVGLDGRSLGLLVASAVVGIAFGDTCYLQSLRLLGARRALLVATTTPAIAAFLQTTMLGEGVPVRLWLGILVTMAGVAWVIGERGRASEAIAPDGTSTRRGVALGLVSAVCQALGLVLARRPLGRMAALDASAVRLLAASLVVLLAGAATRRLGKWRRDIFRSGPPWRLIGASFLGTYIGIWLSLVANREAGVAVAATLTSLAPIFVLPLARLFLGHRVSLRGALGAVLAVGGVVIIFLLEEA